MSRIYLLNYENYYNRKCGQPQTNVLNYEDYYLAEYDNINFNPNDGVSTELIVNYNGTQPNYLLVVDDYPSVGSRWYVLEAQRTRSGQLRLVLRRDLVADFYDDIIDAPAMIERGRLGAYDPYVFNDEGMKFNQIKQSETLLKDETQIPWVVGYLARVQENADAEPEGPTTINIDQPQSFDYTGSSINTWGPSGGTTGLNLGYYTNQNGQKSTAGVKYSHYIYATEPNTIFRYGDDTNYILKRATSTLPISSTLKYPAAAYTDNQYNQYLSRAFESQIDSLNTAASTAIAANDSLVATLQEQEGKIVKIGENKYYRIHVVSQPFTTEVNVTTAQATYFQRMSNFCRTPISEVNNLFYGTPNNNSFKLKAVGTQYYLTLEELTNKIKFTIPTTRRILKDAPYSIFAIPYGSIAITDGPFLSIGLSSKDIATQVAAAISEKMGSQVYDVQLLPYCPVRRAITQDGLGLAKLTTEVDYTLIQQTIASTTSTIGIILWAEESEFTFDISTLFITPYDTKTTNQCVSNRLCSPNYSSVYEFNIAKNGGIGGFNVDCAYKPYSPYIHIWPKGGIHSIYGDDFNDPRGLICSGDFSMPATCDQWAQYEINNKNYQNMFNRQIETMDLTHRIQKTEQAVGAVVGTAQGAMSGATTGAMVGGGYGAIAGAAVGSVVSGVGGAMDVIHGQELRENEREQAFDMFRMGNENIQAMPDTLTKVSAFTPNNKIFPIYETYSATEQEITAFQNYIKYRGMKVGRIDNISNFIWPDWEFVQASIIRFDDLGEDSHTAYEINNELMKGVYLKQ